MAGMCLLRVGVSLLRDVSSRQAAQLWRERSRLDGLGKSVQPVLEFARLLPNGV